MKSKNHVIYDTDQVKLKRLAEEYIMLGRQVSLEDGKLIVFALPQKKVKSKNDKNKKFTRPKRDLNDSR